MKEDNYIIAEIDIKEEEEVNEEKRIINSFEEAKRGEGMEYEEEDKKYENEKEMKEKCKIKINDKIVPFCYNYKFNEKGKYKIVYSFTGNLTKTNYLFSGCSSLTNLDLTHFNTQDVTDMSYMFSECNS